MGYRVHVCVKSSWLISQVGPTPRVQENVRATVQSTAYFNGKPRTSSNVLRVCVYFGFYRASDIVYATNKKITQRLHTYVKKLNSLAHTLKPELYTEDRKCIANTH